MTDAGRGVARFAWASAHAIAWTQYPLPPRPNPWLALASGLAAAVVGGSLWSWSDGAPRNHRIALLVATFGVVASVWFHLRQLTRRRVPSTALWPATLIAVFGLGPLNFLLTPPPPRELPNSLFAVEDDRGRPASLSLAQGYEIEILWTRMLIARVDVDSAYASRRSDAQTRILALYDAAGAATLAAMPADERKAKGDAGDLGLPLLDPEKLPRPERFEIVKLRLDPGPAGDRGATATATDGRTTLRFRLVRTSGTWRFAAARVEFE
jgi:hypothetical protein